MTWGFVLSVLCAGPGYAQSFSTHSYPSDGYAIEVPASWQARPRNTPTGGTLRAFVDTDAKDGAGYCHVEVEPVNKDSMPKLAAMNDRERREFLTKQWTLDDWLHMYPDLASAQDFKFFSSYATALGTHTPAEALEFRYGAPQGYFYRARAHLTLTKDRMYSLWCMTSGRGETEAEDNFRRYLMDFQTVAAKFELIREQ
jgi:hypothetical protein